MKNDIRDSTELANRLRRGDLPESYIAAPEQRELRELVRYRAKLTALRTSAKAQIHAVMAKEGILPGLDDMFGPGGQLLLDQMPFEGAYDMRVESLRRLLEIYTGGLAVVEAELAARLKEHQGYQAIQAICGVGKIIAAIFVAEIGDVSRFPDARDSVSGPKGGSRQSRVPVTSVGRSRVMSERDDDPVPRELVLGLDYAFRVLEALEDALPAMEETGVAPGLQDELATVIRLLHGRLGLDEGGVR